MQPTRRIITGHNDAGDAVFLEDGDCPYVQEIMGAGTADFWQNTGTPADNSPRDYFTGNAVLKPPAGGSVFRVVEFGPHTACPTHRTATVDYTCVISGELYAVVGDDERRMGPGDVIIQRGTIHRWENRSDEPARIVVVLVDAEPLPGLELV